MQQNQARSFRAGERQRGFGRAVDRLQIAWILAAGGRQHGLAVGRMQLAQVASGQLRTAAFFFLAQDGEVRTGRALQIDIAQQIRLQCAWRQLLKALVRSLIDRHGPTRAAGFFAGRADAGKLAGVFRSHCILVQIFLSISQCGQGRIHLERSSWRARKAARKLGGS